VSFLDYCKAAMIDPKAHLANSKSEADLIPQPLEDRLIVKESKIHGDGVFPTDWFEQDELIGLLLDKRFRRTRLLGRFINHDDNPNTVMVPGPNGMYLRATKPLLAEDEITMNYHDTILLKRIVREAGL